MTLTLEVEPETIRRMTGDPEALRLAGKMIDAQFGQKPMSFEEEQGLLALEIEPAEGEDLEELIADVNEGLDAIKAGEKGLTPEELDVRLKAKFPFLRSRTDQQESTARLQERAA
jgi:hypothetical protein